jgi:hypothetical protein
MQYSPLQMLVKMPPQFLENCLCLAPPTKSSMQEFELLPRRSYTAELLILYHGPVENWIPDYCSYVVRTLRRKMNRALTQRNVNINVRFTDGYGGSIHGHVGMPEVCLRNANAHLVRQKKMSMLTHAHSYTTRNFVDANCLPLELCQV